MKPFVLILILLALMTACAPAATPQPTVDVAATVSSISATMVAGTQTAEPTNTPLPTATLLPPTATPVPPSATPSVAALEPTVASLATETPAAVVLPSATPAVPLPGTAAPTQALFIGTLAPLGVENLPIGHFLIENNTEYDLVVSIYGITKPGEKPVYFSYLVKRSLLFDVPWGSYNYVVMIGDKKSFQGAFAIANKDKTTMRVSLKKVIVVGPAK